MSETHPAGKYAAALGPVQDADAPADTDTPPPPHRIVEALLFAGGQPLTAEKAAAAVRGLPADEFQRAVDALARDYRRQNRPYAIQVTDRGYVLALRPRYQRLVDRLAGAPREARLSKAAVDVLSLIAFSQPVTRAEIDSQRGADSGRSCGNWCGLDWWRPRRTRAVGRARRTQRRRGSWSYSTSDRSMTCRGRTICSCSEPRLHIDTELRRRYLPSGFRSTARPDPGCPMRAFAGTALAVALIVGSARAEEPAPFITGQAPAVPPPVVAPVPPPPPPAVVEPGVVIGAPCDDYRTNFALDIILGMQSGVRGQMALWQVDNRVIVIEGFYGALLTKLGGSEAIGAGGRVLFRRTARDGCNSLLYGPGVNVFYQFDDDAQTILAPSLDVAWLRAIGDRGGWQLGLSAGAGISVDGRREGEATATPIISLFTGFRF